MARELHTNYNLANLLLSELEHPANLMGYAKNKNFEADRLKAQIALKKTRDSLIEAKKFTLADDFIELAVEASLRPIEQLHILFERARPPYDKIFIEYSDYGRIETLNRVAPKHGIEITPENPTRCGALIEHVPAPNSDTLFRVQYFGGPTYNDAERLKTVMFIVAWYFDPINEVMPKLISSLGDYEITADWQMSGFEKIDNRMIAGVLGLGPGYLEPWIGEEGVRNSTPQQIEAVNYITRRVGWAVNEFSRHGIVRHIEKTGSRLRSQRNPGKELTVNEFITHAMSEQIGEIRLITTILGLINSGEYVSDLGQFESSFGQKKRVLGVTRKFIEFRTLSLKAPKQKKIILAKIKRQAMDIHKRAHEVMGHWCQRKDTGKRYWRKAHIRGNKTLGFIHKNYVVEKDQKGKVPDGSEDLRVERRRNLYSRPSLEHEGGKREPEVAAVEGGVQSKRQDDHDHPSGGG